MLHYI